MTLKVINVGKFNLPVKGLLVLFGGACLLISYSTDFSYGIKLVHLKSPCNNCLLKRSQFEYVRDILFAQSRSECHLRGLGLYITIEISIKRRSFASQRRSFQENRNQTHFNIGKLSLNVSHYFLFYNFI